MKEYNILFETWIVEEESYGEIAPTIIAMCSSEQLANEIKNMTNDRKNETSIRHVKQKTISHGYTVLENISEYTSQKQEEKRNKILSKLTPDEQKFLGLC